MITTHPVIPMLDYAAPAHTHWRWSVRRLVLLVLALPALATPFVPFTYGTSPLDVVDHVPEFDSEDWTLYPLALTFFAALPILLWKARQLVLSSAPRRWERVALTVVALTVTAPALIVVGRMVCGVPELIRDDNFNSESMLMLSVALGTLAVAATVIALRWRRLGWMAACETLLVAGYLPNAAICLLGFHDNPQLGYWLTVPVAASLGVEMLLPRPRNL